MNPSHGLCLDHESEQNSVDLLFNKTVLAAHMGIQPALFQELSINWQNMASNLIVVAI